MSVLTLLTAQYTLYYFTESPALPFNLFLVEKSREQFTRFFLSRLAVEVNLSSRNVFTENWSQVSQNLSCKETAIHRIPFGVVKQYRISSPSSCYITEGRTWRTSHLALLGQNWSSLRPTTLQLTQY